MISFAEAYQQVMSIRRTTGSETVSLAEAAGRILAADVTADRDLPPFNRSAMDGFACRKADLGGDLRITASVAAGEMPSHTIAPGECTRIMTGAPVPAGADIVVQFELTDTVAENVIHCRELPHRSNIAAVGEDLRQGDVLLPRGTLLDHRHIGTLASCGRVELEVARRPLAAIITTGDELVEPDQQPAPAQIRNSNASQLQAQLAATGTASRYYGIIPDTPEAIAGTLERGRRECDLLLFSGGVSMGDFDHVPAVLREGGLEILFEQVRIKPGKPTTVTVGEDIVCFGLPGNPVAVFMVFERLVKPFLYQMMGHDYRERVLSLRLADTYQRKHALREAWIPVRVVENGYAEIIKYHGSGHFHALTVADGYLTVPAGVESIPGGTEVDVRLF